MKLIATDLDGTLLRNDRTLSHRTLNALRTATESGAEVVFVTARPPRFVEALPTGLVGTAICSTSRTPAGRDQRDSCVSLPFDMNSAYRCCQSS